MTREQLTELYKLHVSGGRLNYGSGKYPVSISYSKIKTIGGDLFKKVHFTDYRKFLTIISFLELSNISEIEQYLEVIKENVL